MGGGLVQRQLGPPGRAPLVIVEPTIDQLRRRAAHQQRHHRLPGARSHPRDELRPPGVRSGSGATLVAKANDQPGCVDDDPDNPNDPPGASCIQSWGTQLGAVTIDSATWAATPNLVFTPQVDVAGTPGNESDVWVFVHDADLGGVVPPSAEPCQTRVTGETCIDDIGLFVAADVGL